MVECARCRAVAAYTWAGHKLCGYCMGRLTSVLTHCGRVNGEPLSEEQRDALWAWFLKTKYFASHRRMSRGRAKRLMGALNLNPANVSSRGPHDLVVDGAPSPSPYPDFGYNGITLMDGPSLT